MEAKQLQEQIDGINKKLDVILAEIALQQRHRREMEDLKEDLIRVGKDLYGTAVAELDEVHDYIQTGDVLYLVKKLLRNIRNITKAFEAMENAMDFLKDVAPVSRDLFIDFMNKLDELDRKGYFQFAREFVRVGERVVTSFKPSDVEKLGDNIVTILNTVKNLTQPETLQVVNNALEVYKKLDIDVERDVSLLSLLKELNSPETKRGLAYALQFLKRVAVQQPEGAAQPSPN